MRKNARKNGIKMDGMQNERKQGAGKQKSLKEKAPKIVPEHLQSINIVEVGPGTGVMMCDILRTLKQFTGNLRNV